jgi:hypothetical protein
MRREPIRVLACVDGRVGYECLHRLICGGVEVVGVVVLPEAAARFRPEIRELCALHAVPSWDVEAARRYFDVLVAPLAPDLLLSLYFDHPLDDRWRSLSRAGAVGLHPGCLPFGQGFHDYFWSVMEGGAAGVTLRRMEPGSDAGEVLGQLRVSVGPWDDGAAVGRRHEDAAIRLFTAAWPGLAADGREHVEPRRKRSRRRAAETPARPVLPVVDPFERGTALGLISRLHAATSEGGGCLIPVGAEVYRVRLQLQPAPAGVVPARSLREGPGGDADGVPSRVEPDEVRLSSML